MCNLCKSSFSYYKFTFADGDIVKYANNSGNLRKHVDSDTHQERFLSAKYELAKAGGKITSYMPVLSTVNESSTSYLEEIHELRVLTHASLLSYGMNPTMIENVFKPYTDIGSAVRLLQQSSVQFGTESRMKSDITEATSLIDKEIKKRLQNEYLSICVDSASLKHDSAIAVMVSCAKLGRPVLISLIYPDIKSHDEDPDNHTYNFELAAKDITVVTDKMGIDLEKQATCIMGDNVNHNSALANHLRKKLLYVYVYVYIYI